MAKRSNRYGDDDITVTALRRRAAKLESESRSTGCCYSRDNAPQGRPASHVHLATMSVMSSACS